MEFGEVAIYFSKEEWDSLNYEQKELYKDVTMENYQTLRSLGWVNRKPTIVSKIEQGEVPYVSHHQQNEEEDRSKCTNNGPTSGNSPERIPDTLTSTYDVNNNISPGQHDKHANCISRNTLNISLTKSNPLKSEEKVTKPCKYILRKKRGHPATTTKENMDTNKNTQMHSRNMYKCGKCDKNFNVKSDYLSHQRIHNTQKELKCSKCPKSKATISEHGKCFNHKAQLSTHQKTYKGEKTFNCTECGKYFLHKSSLDRHQRNHIKVKPFICSECGKFFARKHELVTHQKIHIRNKPFACSECGKCFSRKHELATHQKIHIGMKPFACTECSKCFRHKSGLSRHSVIHTGERPFVCSECRQCFNRKYHLVRHQRIHTGGEPFTCSVCRKMFNNKADLNQHLIVHSGKKQFVCLECRKSYTCKSHLVRHQMTHTGKTWL